MFQKNKIGIISYCDHIRTYASVNHQFYADQHNYTYIYDIAPTINSVYKNKIEKILKYMDLFDWVFWIDDDAFFLQYQKPLDNFLRANKKYDLIYCKSPLNQGKWTYLSSGNFFLRSNRKTKEFLLSCLSTDISVARDTWNEEEDGMFTNGDQDIMVHLLKRDKRFSKGGFSVCLPYETFNTRPFHFEKSTDEHFLVHFTGNDKNEQALDFAKKFGLSPALIPDEDFASYYGVYKPLLKK